VKRVVGSGYGVQNQQ